MSLPQDPWPTDGVRAAAVVAVLVCEIDMSQEEDRQALLAEFEVAAWPTARSQKQ